MRRPKICLLFFILALSLHSPSSRHGVSAAPSAVSQTKSTEISVNNSLAYHYVDEPVSAHLTFSQGEANNNSIRIYDSRKREVPSQLWNVEYYPGSRYIHNCNITFLGDLVARGNTPYRVNYSSSDIGMANYSQWSDLKISGDGFHRDVRVENSYFIAYIKVNSTLGVYKFIMKPDNVSRLLPDSSLTGYTLGTGAHYYTANDTQASRVLIDASGPLFIRVILRGTIGGISISQSIVFYAHLPYIESTLEVSNSGMGVDWIRPLQIFFKHGAFENYTLSTGEGGSLAAYSSTYPDGNAYRPQSWWALVGRSSNLLLLQKPLANLSYVILQDTPTYTTVTNVGNSTLLDSKDVQLAYKFRISLLGKFDAAAAKAAADIFRAPPFATVKLPVAFMSVELPSRKEIYTRFTVSATISVLRDANNCTIYLTAPRTILFASGKSSEYLGFLKKGSIRMVNWSVFGTSAGKLAIGVSLRSKEGSANASSDIQVYIPAIAPPVKVKIRVVDNLGKFNISSVNVTIYDSQSLLRNSAITDKNGGAEASLEPGAYTIKVLDGGRLIGAKNVTIFGPTSLIINCWIFMARFRLLGPDDNPLPEESRALVVLYDNASGILVPIGSANSNSTGYATVVDVRNGTYIAKGYVRRVESGALKVVINSEGAMYTLYLKFLTIRARVLSDEEEPVSNCTVSIYDLDGHLVDQRAVDENGGAEFPNLAYQNYTYLVDWAGTNPTTRVAFGFIRPNRLVTEVTIRTRIYTLTINAMDMWGNPLQRAQVILRPVQGITRRILVTGDDGLLSLQLSTGNYSVEVSSGGYIGSLTVNLRSSDTVEVRCGINFVIYISIALSSSGWIALGFIWRWKTRGFSYEELKVKDMITKLDELYEAGEVEYPLYRKLKDEYSSQLRRVRTR